MMRRLFLLCLLVVAVPQVVAAETVVRTAETVTIAAEQQIANDFYAAGATVINSGTVEADMYAAGGVLTMNGVVAEDVTLFAGRAEVTGDVGDDLRIAAGEITVAGVVGGDVFIIGGVVKILSTADIAGDVYVFGGDVAISGAVDGSVRGYTERILIDAPVGGDVEVSSGLGLTLGSRADIGGSVQYTSNADLVRSPDAVVTGEIITQSSNEVVTTEFSYTEVLIPALLMLFASLVLYLLGRDFFIMVVDRVFTRPVQAAVYGTSIFLLGPVVAIILLATVLGAIIGLGLIGSILLLAAIAYAVAPMVVGVALWRLFGGVRTVQPLAILLGVVVIHSALLIPVLGAVLVFGSFVLAAGACLSSVLSRLAAK